MSAKTNQNFHQSNKKGNKQNNHSFKQQFVAPQNYTLFISNYPYGRSPEAILNILNTQIFNCFGASPMFDNPSPIGDGFTVSVLNHIQYDAMLQLNGALVYNYPIWIVKFHFDDPFANQFTIFSKIFIDSLSEGQVDLTNFASKFQIADALNEGDASIVNFNNREFVEFLFFRLGVESRDNRFWVSSLILCYNGIKSISYWVPLLHFLPNLKYINLKYNNLESEPNLPDYLQISVDYDPISQTKNAGGKSKGQNNYPAFDENVSTTPPTVFPTVFPTVTPSYVD